MTLQDPIPQSTKNYTKQRNSEIKVDMFTSLSQGSLESTQSNQAASAYANYLGAQSTSQQPAEQKPHKVLNQQSGNPGSRNYSNYHSSLG